jgi:hypothetical protein
MSTKTHSIFWATKSIASFEMDRLCVCEGIMLSVFLNYPFIEHRNPQLMGNIRDAGLPTMWDRFLIFDTTYPAIIAYMHNIVFPPTMTPHDESMLCFRQVMEDFNWRLILRGIGTL